MRGIKEQRKWSDAAEGARPEEGTAGRWQGADAENSLCLADASREARGSHASPLFVFLSRFQRFPSLSLLPP